MVHEDLVQVSTISRTSYFQVIPGEPTGLNMTTINHADRTVLETKAIYRLHGNVLTYCVAAPGQSRPCDFVTQPGDGNTCVVLKRVPMRVRAGWSD